MKPTPEDYRLARDLSFISLAGILNDNDKSSERHYYFKDEDDNETNLKLITQIINDGLGKFTVISRLIYMNKEVFSCNYDDFIYKYDELFKLDSSTQSDHLIKHVLEKPSVLTRLMNDTINKLDKCYRHQVISCEYKLSNRVYHYISLTFQNEMLGLETRKNLVENSIKKQLKKKNNIKR